MITKTIDLAGDSLHYADFGGQGPTTVLVHGLGGSHANWLAVAPALALSGRVVALDLPGFGRSARRAGGSTVGVMSHALEQFIDFMSPEPVHLIGNSMGGTLAVLEAYARPDRIASALLVCPALPAPLGAATDPRWLQTLALACAPWGHVLLRRHAAEMGPERMFLDLMDLCCVDPSRVRRDIVAAHVAMSTERASIPWTEQAFADATRSLMGHLLFGGGLREALRGSRVPTLIVHGRRDRLVDIRTSRAAVTAYPRIELIELPELGHVPQLEDPEGFVAIAGRWFDRFATNPGRRSTATRSTAA
jgi:pimeloyl-ACP methyl ester carboxylesterase